MSERMIDLLSLLPHNRALDAMRQLAVELDLLRKDHDRLVEQVRERFERCAPKVEERPGVPNPAKKIEELRDVIGEVFTALVVAGPAIGDVATASLPHAVAALATERDQAKAVGTALAAAVRAFLYGYDTGAQGQVLRGALESALHIFESGK